MTATQRYEAKLKAFRANEGLPPLSPSPARIGQVDSGFLRPAPIRSFFRNQFTQKPEILNELPPFPQSRYIPLTMGKRAIVSDVDYDRVMQFSWRAKLSDWNWYALGGRSSERQLHAFIVGARSGETIDHQNGDGLDNRRDNLRHCSNAQNTRNAKTYSKKCTAKLKGVYFDRRAGKYRAQIMCQYKKINLGNFTDEESAGLAYDDAARRLFGEFARPNFALEVSA